MINYIDLPRELKQYQIIPSNLDELIPKRSTHYWNTWDLSMFFTKEGLNWFSDRGIVLQSFGNLFRAPANFEAPIHTDVPSEFALNFVLEGYGEMQWVEAEGEKESKVFVTENGGVYPYTRYKSISKVDVLDKWTGDMALVRTTNFHRIKTMEVDRICLSVRPTTYYSFEEAARLLGV
jgi:hypothetical protein